MGISTEPPPFSGTRQTNSAVKKRKNPSKPTEAKNTDGGDGDEPNVAKRARVTPSASVSSVRRSARLEGNNKAVDYRSDNFERIPLMVMSKACVNSFFLYIAYLVFIVPLSAGIDKQSSTDNIGNRLGKRVHNPCVNSCKSN
jgi:hypothetical protein